MCPARGQRPTAVMKSLGSSPGLIDPRCRRSRWPQVGAGSCKSTPALRGHTFSNGNPIAAGGAPRRTRSETKCCATWGGAQDHTHETRQDKVQQFTSNTLGHVQYKQRFTTTMYNIEISGEPMYINHRSLSVQSGRPIFKETVDIPSPPTQGRIRRERIPVQHQDICPNNNVLRTRFKQPKNQGCITASL